MQALRQVTSPLFLLPAYGRTYKTRQQALDAWTSGKDFQILDGPYCSIRDIKALQSMSSGVYIQYDMGVLEV